MTPSTPKGLLIAFEGLDQSGKQTQAERLKAAVEQRGRTCVLLDFPSYETHIGHEIDEALHGGRDYGPDVMQLLYVANRYEKKPLIERIWQRTSRGWPSSFTTFAPAWRWAPSVPSPW